MLSHRKAQRCNQPSGSIDRRDRRLNQEAGGTSASLSVTQPDSCVIHGSVTDPRPQTWSPSTRHLLELSGRTSCQDNRIVIKPAVFRSVAASRLDHLLHELSGAGDPNTEVITFARRDMG